MEPTRPESDEYQEWAEAWHRHRSRSALESNLARAGLPEEAFWLRYATWTSSTRGDYPGALVTRVAALARPGGTVLDIGAGAGTFAIPLAATARKVTAVEPSPAQVKRLSAAIADAGARNIDILQSRWEEVDIQSLDSQDLVLAVHSFQMLDIAVALRKMCAMASSCIALIHTAGHNLATLSRELFDIEPGPDYTYLQRILIGLGYDPTVTIVAYGYDIPLDIQLDALSFNPGLSEAQCATLRRYFQEHGLTNIRDGKAWIHRSYRDALITITSDNNLVQEELP